MQEVAQSPLDLDEAQKEEAVRRAVEDAAEAFFSRPTAQLYGRRLWHMADHFERSERPEPARIARAEARRLFHGAEARSSPFAVGLFEKILTLSVSSAAAGPG